MKESATYIQNQFSSFDAASSAWIVLKGFGQTVEGLKLLVILLVLYLVTHVHMTSNVCRNTRDSNNRVHKMNFKAHVAENDLLGFSMLQGM